MLDGLHLAQFAARPSGAMSWFSPSIALPILIGLGLDYDIFFTEKVKLTRLYFAQSPHLPLNGPGARGSGLFFSPGGGGFPAFVHAAHEGRGTHCVSHR